MDIKRPNDILVATINSPNATTFDFLSADINPENTSLYTKDEYKQSDFIKNTFKDQNGNFDDVKFNEAYNKAALNYKEMSDKKYLDDLDTIMYSPFDITRPKDAKTFKVEVGYSKDINPFKELYSRTAINSIDESPLSLREIAQQGKIFDTKNNKFLDESANDRGLLGKLFSETLVYAQWDADGVHYDPNYGVNVNHKKGDWKYDNDGNLYTETLGNREIYGRKVLNPMDVLTTDGSFANKFDLFDNDNKETSALKTTIKLAAEITPLLIPGFNTYYAGVRAAVGLASVLPTLYKSFEGILLGDMSTASRDVATAAEGYLAKYNQTSLSDEGQKSMFNYENVAQMTSDIFAQIFEQRAAASLSKIIKGPKAIVFTEKQKELAEKANMALYKKLAFKEIDEKEFKKLQEMIITKLPGFKELQEQQSNMAKMLSLGYMALTSTADIYGDAINSGFDRRTAGFAAIAAASGQYGLMMNNRMGDWFLDKTTGYSTEVNKALMRKTLKEFLPKIEAEFKDYAKSPAVAKGRLSMIFRGIKNKFDDVFNNSSVIGEALMKNAFIEGVEEVTEEATLDATKGIVDLLSYLGVTKNKASFNTLQNVFSLQGAERYLASLLGGILGGAMFEFHRTKLEPWLTGIPLEETKSSIYDLVSTGNTELLLKEINKQRSKLGNSYISPITLPGEIATPAEKGKSQADAVADFAINIVKNIDGIMNAEGLVLSDEQIVNKAIKDFLIIRDLEKAKGDNSFGIEAMIISDFRNTAKALTDAVGDLNKLATGNTEADLTKVNETINELRKRRDQILNGEFAEKYYDQALFYLAKDISKHWINIDKNTYVYAKYRKNYNEFPVNGLGITQESIDKEYKNYIDSKDVRTELEMATNAYRDLEAKSNQAIGQFVEGGYSEELRKTLKNVIDLQRTLNNFDVSTEENKKLSIDNFTYVANKLNSEASVGKEDKIPIIPWDAINTDFANSILANDLIYAKENGKLVPFSAIANKVVQKADGTSISKQELVMMFLDDVIKTFPQEIINPNIISERFNSVIATYNSNIDKNITKLQEDLLKNPSKETSDIITNLMNSRLDISLQSAPFINSALYDQTIEEFRDSKGLDENWLEVFNIINDSSEIKTYDEIIESEEIENEEKVKKILSSEIFRLYSTYYSNSENKLLAFSKGTLNIKQEIDDFVESLESKKDLIREYKKVKQQAEISLNNSIPKIWNIHNYVLDTVLKEIKSGNLDKELFNRLQQYLNKRAVEVGKQYFSLLGLNNEQLIDFFINKDKIKSELTNLLDEMNAPDFIYLEDTYNGVPFNIDSKFALEDTVEKLNKFDEEFDPEELSKIQEVINILKNKNKYIANSIFEFLRTFAISTGETNEKTLTVFKVLENEEFWLNQASSIYNYFSEGIRISNIDSAINTIKLLKSVVYAMQTTEISPEDIYGFIFSRQQFVKNNALDSEVGNLKTITSDVATLIAGELDRIENKLAFLKEFAKSNSSKLYTEQEIIRDKTTEQLLNKWKELSNKKIIVKEKPLIPDLEDILEANINPKKALLNIENRIFEYYKGMSKEEKVNIFKELISLANVPSHSEFLGAINKESKIIKDLDFIYYIAATTAVYSGDFNNKLLNVIEKEFDKAPFYTQEMAIKVAYATIIDPELFSEIVKASKEIQDSDSIKEEDTKEIKTFKNNLLKIKTNTNVTDLITYTLGNAGSGKTTVIFKSLILLLKDKNPNLSIWFAAPNMDKASDFQKETTENVKIEDFKINTFNKVDLFEKLGLSTIWNKINEEIEKINKGKFTFDGEYVSSDDNKITLKDFDLNNISQDIPNLIFIDEITHFNSIELELLNRLAEHLKANNIFLKIFGAGDVAQGGAKINNVPYNVNRVLGVFAPKLSVTIRAGNTQQRANNDSLDGTVNYILANYVTDEDLPFILRNVNNGEVKLRVNTTQDNIKGNLVISKELVTKNTIKPIINALKKDKKLNIGLLLKSELKDQIKSFLVEEGIEESRIKVYSPDNIQGSEKTYLVFDTDMIDSGHLLNEAQDLYTFVSRAKVGSIIINTGNLKYIKLSNQIDEVSEDIIPLSKEVIEEIRIDRVKKLKELLAPDFVLKYPDFEFGKSEEDDKVTNDELVVDNSFTNLENTEDVNQANLQDLNKKSKEKEFRDDTETYNFYSFYNDLNVSIKNKGNNIEIISAEKKLGNKEFVSGLEYLTTVNKSTTLSKQEFEKETNNLISLKYEVIKNIINDSNFLVPSSNETIKKIIGEDTYQVKSIKSTLVLLNTDYAEEFNAPFAKQKDDKTKHLNNGDSYTNLYLKIEYKKKTYYLHLISGPSLTTLMEEFGKDSNTYKNYVKFQNNEVEELEVPKENIKVNTSTWFEKVTIQPSIKDFISENDNFKIFNNTDKKEYSIENWVKENNISDITTLRKKFTGLVLVNNKSKQIITLENWINNKETKYSLRDLEKIPGLKFIDLTTGKTTNSFGYQLFPSAKSEGNSEKAFELFKSIYDKVSFGESITEEKLRQMYNKYKGKPYIAVTFVPHLQSGNSQVKILLLRSNTRDYKHINPSNNSVDIKKGINEKYFTGSQVLDLLIKLGTERKELFNGLFVEGEEWKNFAKYFKTVSDEIKRDLISFITYEKANEKTSILRQVLTLIHEEINKGNTDKTDIKAKLIKIIKTDKGLNLWWRKFFNFKTFESRFASILEDTNDLTSEQISRVSELSKLIGDINNFWANEAIYHNVRIKALEGSENKIINYKIEKSDEDLDYLYTNLIPEGPRILINLKDLFGKKQKGEETVEPEIQEIEEEIEEDIEEIPEEILPTIQEYFNNNSNSFIGNILQELSSYINDTTVKDSEKDSINRNWPNLYKYLETLVPNINGKLTKIIDLPLEALPALWEVLGLDPNYGEDFEREAIILKFQQILQIDIDNDKIWC